MRATSMEKISQIVLLILLVYGLLLAFSVNISALAIECLASDHEALVDFKNGLKDPQKRLSSWRNTNCCQWHGIYCNNVTGAVVAIDLHRRDKMWHLSGEIRPSLLKLKSLQSLDLSFNRFNDIPIPKFFGSLMNLQSLNLSYAGFAGIIPPHLGNLSHLQSLDLKSFSLKVENLQWVADLVSLKHLAMDGVNLSLVAGTDLVSAVNQLPFLMELHLSSCKIFGYISSPPSLNFTSLSVLDLSSNSFVSMIPDWLVNISTLQHIDISNSGLYGKIPLGLRYLPKLQSLNLRNNNLTASCSQLFMGGWERIQVLDLGGNKLNGRLPSSFGNLIHLTYLDLAYNAIEGVIPSSIGELCNLNMLDISENNLTGTLPEFLQGVDNCPSGKPLPNLTYFIMSYNQLYGKIPDWLVQLENLAGIGLAYNLLEGPIPVSLGSLQNIVTLELEGNRLNGSLPDSLGQLSKLSRLDVSSNQLTGMVTEDHFSKLRNNLTGRVPLSLSNCSLLEVLDLGNNNLFGSILGDLPPPLRNLSILETMDLGNNRLSGVIPTWFGKDFPFLRILILRSNAFSGELLLEFSKLGSLQVLDLAINDFSGNIPPSLGDLKAITQVQRKNRYLLYGKYDGHYYEERLNVYMKDQILTYTKTLSLVTSIDLSDNNFSGNIPNEITKLFGLVVLNLSRNHITGQIPGTMSNLLQLSSLDLSNNQLSGTIPSSLSSLSFLGFLDLSSNNLLGVIPYTGHMTTFDAIAFTGNPGLCGPPLPVKCSGDDDKKQ
ncbi:LRR receptor-like kinase resistance protein, partial [Trifolium pratense]